MFEQDLIEKIYNLYPECRKTGTATRQQVVSTMDKFGITKRPNFIYRQAVARGVYSLDMSVGTVVKMPKKQTPKPETAVVEVSEKLETTTRLSESALIPTKDSNFVSFGNFKDVETIIESRQFYPVYITGPTGNGKSTMVEQVCAKLGRGLIRVNLNMTTDEDALIGTKTLEDGNVKVVEGPVLIAMRLGIPLLLDEIDAGGSNALMCLQPILEGKPYYFKLKNEVIKPTPGFNIFATANTKGKGSDDGRYIGTNVLNEAFLERFSVTLEQEYPSVTVETKIMNKLLDSLDCSNDTFANNLVRWAASIRRSFDEGAIDETITTRRLIHIARAYSIFKDEKKAIQMCINRFDKAVQSAFVTMFETVSKPAETVTPQETKDSTANLNEEIAF
jgi:hypothetical protein